MQARSTTRRPVLGVVLGAVILLTTACIDVGTVPPVDPAVLGAIPPVPESAPSTGPGPLVSGGGGGVVDAYAPSYGHIAQFLAANDAKPDERGLTNTAGMTPQECRRTPSCAKDGGAGRIAQRNRLVTDVGRSLDGGGGAIIRLEGTVDNQNQRITGQDSVKLARNRANNTAALLEKQILAENPDAQVFIGKETRGAACGAAGVVCIETAAHPQIVDQCTDPRGNFLDRCEKGGNVRQRGTLASAVLTAPALRFGDPRDGADGGRGSSGGGAGGTIDANAVGGGTPNPGAGIFGSGPSSASATGNASGGDAPAGTSGSGSTDGGSADSSGDSFLDDSRLYCSLYPEDCADVDGDDPLSVRIVVDAPTVFRVGGKLREQEVQVVNVVLYCGDRPCPTGGNVSLGTFRGRLDLVSGSGSYRLCAEGRTTGCQYYYSDAAAHRPAVLFDGNSLQGGVLRAGFLSPTPSGSGSPVKVRPTLTVDALVVERFVPVRRNAPGCYGNDAPRDCWDWMLDESIDARGAASVATTVGERFARNGDEHRIDRVVVGTVGS